jgi:hypothetical protein
VAILPQPQHTFARAIYGLHEQRAADEQARPYLGASSLGDPCARRLWYGFRWVARERFDGRMLRLFDTGHREEARLLDEMRAAGIEVWDRQPDGRQFRVTVLRRARRGPPGRHRARLARSAAHAARVRRQDRQGQEARRDAAPGFRKTYPKYHAQGTVYAGLMDLDRIAFAFVCKDDDTSTLSGSSSTAPSSTG